MREKLPYVLVTIILLSLVYSPITELHFATVDDKWMLLDEKLILVERFNWDFIVEVFSRINSLQYSPLNTFYYYFIYQINGYDPYYYHLGSFIIHALNTALVFVLLKKILSIFQVKNVEVISFAVTLIWAIHPFNIESVIWISASKIPLYTFFGLLSFILFIDAYLKDNLVLYICSLVSFSLSFFAKEQAVLLPIMMLVFVLTYNRRYDYKINWTKIMYFLFPLFILALTFGLITIYVAIYGGGSHNIDRFPFEQRIILTFYALCFYIFNNFIPIDLHYHYPFPMKGGEPLAILYYMYPFLFLIILWQLYLVIKTNRNFYLYLFSFGIFIIHLLLCVQIFPLARAAMLADRYMYIPSIGLLLIAGIALNERWNLSFSKTDKSSIIIIFLFIAYTFFLCFYSHGLAENWKGMQL